MKVGCISVIAAPATYDARIIVLPEYTNPPDVRLVVKRNPNAIIVAAVEERNRGHAMLMHRGDNLIDYLKVGTDGRTKGSRRVPASPVRTFDNLIIGVVVCMDVQEPVLLNSVLAELKASIAPYKLLCIPADMGGEWFSNAELMPPFEGVSVALCNHPTNHQYRCRSFISDTGRMKRAEQQATESIYLDLDASAK